jgi:two-component system OmpR family sensor kinase
MSRLPIRIRLTLPFALAMAVVLTGLGAFVYVRVGSTLLASTDQNLLAQATEATARLQSGGQLLDRDATGAASVAEVIGAGGGVLSSYPIGLPPLLGAASVRSVLAGHDHRATRTITGQPGRWRLLAIRAQTGKLSEVLVLGGSLRERDESLERLRHELLFSSPLALLVATLAGYILAGAALRPVEAMRRKAEAISAATPGTRLPVPRARDEITRLAETLNEMLGRLETAFEHERRFIAEASHELRTPLALLRTELELALRKPRSREELEEALHSAAEETDRLTALAADLLLIARAEEKAVPLHLETLSVGELLGTVATRFSSRAAELGREIVVSLDEELSLEADPRRVEQALGNLVDNAFLHGAGTVRLSARRAEGDRLELHVSDEGSGFPSGFAARAFDRFSRADEARRRSGSGLGLAIVRSIALAHHGSAGVTATERGGADVWLSLPLGPGPARDRQRGHLSSRLRRPGSAAGAAAESRPENGSTSPL